MPILQAETHLFPECLFDDADSVRETDRVWRVLHARPRQEKCIARTLLDRQVPFYLPLVPRRTKVRGRILTAHVPLFPGYVFLFGDGGERRVALETGRVVNSLEVLDQQRLWQNLGQVRRLIASGAPLSLQERLEPGTAVEIHSGPLRGLRGIILRSASGRRFVVRVDFIQQGASVLLDEATLVRCDPGSGRPGAEPSPW